MLRQLLLGSALILVAMTDSPAGEETGSEILDTCLSERRALRGDPTASVRYGLCLGYLKGVADSLDGMVFCLPDDPDTARTTQRLKRVFLTYAARHREKLDGPAGHTVLPAFEQAFPCKQAD